MPLHLDPIEDGPIVTVVEYGQGNVLTFAARTQAHDPCVVMCQAEPEVSQSQPLKTSYMASRLGVMIVFPDRLVYKDIMDVFMHIGEVRGWHRDLGAEEVD